MRIDNTKTYKSSFLSMDKDLETIINKISKNSNLQKLLFYNTKDCMSKPELTDEQVSQLFEENIKLIPKIKVDGSLLNYLVISFDNFSPNFSNPEYRDNILEIDIICHIDQWQLPNYQLRPYRIAGELDGMLDGAKLSGIGKLEFLGGKFLLLTDEYAGFCIMYKAIHGDEDRIKIDNNYEESSEEIDPSIILAQLGLAE